MYLKYRKLNYTLGFPIFIRGLDYIMFSVVTLRTLDFLPALQALLY
ncbi:HNH endonuclease [Bacillus phage BSTP3]|nr:HNH endonuclease [Bacillus phage BSTP3]